MTLISEPSVSLKERAQNIILKPGSEWDRIATETTSVNGLFKSYAMILAAITPVCTLIGSLLFPVSILGFSYRPSPVAAVVSAVVAYLLALGMIFVMGLIIEALAPNFDGVKDRRKAMQVAVYASTASWLAGVFTLMPQLAALAIIGGLYSLYLLYLGLPKLMQAPEGKALPYTVAAVVIAIVLSLVAGVVVGSVTGMVGRAALFGAAPGVGALGGEVGIGDAKVDLGKLEAASKQLQADAAALQARAAAGAAAGTSGTIGAEALKALLPASLAGYARGDVSTESAGAAGVGVTSAKAEYAKGEARMTVEIIDMSAMGGLAGLAGALGVNSSKETATGYEKVSTVSGRTTTEEYDRAAKRGKYGVLAAGRVMVQAEGAGVTMDELKAAVDAVGPERVEALAKS